VEDGPLQHALEAECRLRLALGCRPRDHGGRRLDELRELAPAGSCRRRRPEHRAAASLPAARAEVLDRHELVTPGPRPLEGGVQIQFQVLAHMVTPRYNSILGISIDQPARRRASASFLIIVRGLDLAEQRVLVLPRETVHLHGLVSAMSRVYTPQTARPWVCTPA